MMDTAVTDVSLKRRLRKYSRREQIGRVLWGVCAIFFRFSPRPFWGWRVLLLRLLGAKVGRSVRIYPTVRVQIPWNLEIGDEVTIGDLAIIYALGPICVDKRSTISQGAHLCAGTHDFESAAFTLLRQSISVGKDVWICAEAFIGPNVRLGDRSVVGARAVVVKDVEASKIVAGNPASVIRDRIVT